MALTYIDYAYFYEVYAPAHSQQVELQLRKIQQILANYLIILYYKQMFFVF